VLLIIRGPSSNLGVVSRGLLAPEFSAVAFFAATGLPESRLLQLPHEILALILDHVFEPWHLESFPEDEDYAHACADAKHASSNPPCRGPLLTCKTFYKLLKDRPRTCFIGTIHYHLREPRPGGCRIPRPAPPRSQWLVPMVKTVYLPEPILALPNLVRDTRRLFPSLHSIELYEFKPDLISAGSHPEHLADVTTLKDLSDSSFLTIALSLTMCHTRNTENHLPSDEDFRMVVHNTAWLLRRPATETWHIKIFKRSHSSQWELLEKEQYTSSSTRFHRCPKTCLYEIGSDPVDRVESAENLACRGGISIVYSR